MVKLRLKRMGTVHKPFYRIGAVDQRKKRDGALIEELGHFNPMDLDVAKQVHVKADRINYWLSVGAQPSETVATLLKRVGIDPTPGAKKPTA
jgi:small subunit ribosomal protein S16